MLEFIKNFYNFLFKLNYPTDSIPIDDLLPDDDRDSEEENTRATRRRLVVFINILLAFVFIGSFLLIGLSSVSGTDAPEIISNSFAATLGYFSGILTNFFGHPSR